MSYDECFLRWGAISLVDGLIDWQSDWQVEAMKHPFAPIGILNTHHPLSQTSAALPRSPLPSPHGEGAWVVIGAFGKRGSSSRSVSDKDVN